MHPLLTVFADAISGRFPASDGGVTYLPPLDDGWEAVVSLTGHAYVASRFGEDALRDLRPDGFGGVLHPRVLMRLAGEGGEIGVVDTVLFAFGTGGGERHPNPTLEAHPRVAYARTRRVDVRAYGDMDGLFTLGIGLGGRLEVSVETSSKGTGRGRDLIEQALSLVPEGEPLFASISPGNARSLRAFLAVGFVPIGSEVLIKPVGIEVETPLSPAVIPD